MGQEFKLLDSVSTPATLTRKQKAELLKLSVLKNTSLKKEIHDAVDCFLLLEENQKILRESNT